MSPSHRELIQDLRAHAHEAPRQCAALMRRAASVLEDAELAAAAPALSSLRDINRRLSPETRVKGAPCS